MGRVFIGWVFEHLGHYGGLLQFSSLEISIISSLWDFRKKEFWVSCFLYNYVAEFIDEVVFWAAGDLR